MSYALTVLYGSVRRDRQGIRAARFIEQQITARGHTPTLIDALELDLPLLDRMYKEYEPGTAPANLESMAKVLKASDGFIVVSGEYNHGIPPALKNMLDHFLEEWLWRPSAIVCYSQGPFGGVRAAMQLRMTLAELGMPSISSLLPVPRVQDAFAEDGTPTDDAWHRRAGRFLDEFDWHVAAQKAQRAIGKPY
ncbi:MAG: NAD(P)H-dependent oxidoreductase [Proteobacteria bacterium]|nr:NAD(P)H-dependent oxidoreductase [Pseudomonadota bacterium]